MQSTIPRTFHSLRSCRARRGRGAWRALVAGFVAGVLFATAVAALAASRFPLPDVAAERIDPAWRPHPVSFEHMFRRMR